MPCEVHQLLINAVTGKLDKPNALYWARLATLQVYSTSMAGLSRRSTIIGCVGVLCLALYWASMFLPGVANTLPVSSFGKFVVFGIFLSSLPLTIVAAIRGSKLWWVAVAASAFTLWDLYIRFSRVLT